MVSHLEARPVLTSCDRSGDCEMGEGVVCGVTFALWPRSAYGG